MHKKYHLNIFGAGYWYFSKMQTSLTFHFLNSDIFHERSKNKYLYSRNL